MTKQITRLEHVSSSHIIRPLCEKLPELLSGFPWVCERESERESEREERERGRERDLQRERRKDKFCKKKEK